MLCLLRIATSDEFLPELLFLRNPEMDFSGTVMYYVMTFFLPYLTRFY